MPNFSVKLLFTVSVIILFSVTAFSDVVADEEYVGECTGNDVHIRATASKGAIISKANSGDMLVIIGTQGDWYNIQLPEFISVWISRKYVKAEPGKDGVVTGDNVNIRTAAKTTSTVVGKAKKGSKVEIMGIDEDWFLIIPPEDATGWISRKYVKKLGLKYNYLNALKDERNRYLNQAAAYYESIGQSDISKAYMALTKKVEVKPNGKDVTPPPVEDAEKKQFEVLMLKYKLANFDRDSADLAYLKSLAEEIRVFAENCKSGIKQQATNTYNELLGKIKKIVDERKKLEDKKAADNIKIQKEQENERMLKEVNIRLMRRLINKYVATGVIIDEPLESGEMVYYLAVDNQKKYRLVTIVPNLNLRDYWRREVGIVGKIVYDEDEEYPIVLCESVQIFDK